MMKVENMQNHLRINGEPHQAGCFTGWRWFQSSLQCWLQQQYRNLQEHLPGSPWIVGPNRSEFYVWTCPSLTLAFQLAGSKTIHPNIPTSCIVNNEYVPFISIACTLMQKRLIVNFISNYFQWQCVFGFNWTTRYLSFQLRLKDTAYI